MIREWITIENRGGEIERPIHTNNEGRYVVVNCKRLSVDRLKRAGRIINYYKCGHQEVGE